MTINMHFGWQWAVVLYSLIGMLFLYIACLITMDAPIVNEVVTVIFRAFAFLVWPVFFALVILWLILSIPLTLIFDR